jgi:indole-3-glycerol phosphate synthase/phosphoribosylanthranilate isomerase/anthranilate synthase/indole-3-glycerol phosphate synthase/phosphoribosylanthranilate isomerase
VRIKETVNKLTSEKFKSPIRLALSSVLRDLGTMGVISELKPGSPSKGQLLDKLNLESRSNDILKSTVTDIEGKISAMILGGACAFSVLTEPRRFSASYGNLVEVSRIAPKQYPILLKDFIIDESQIQLGKLCGASNALLIVSICDPEEMCEIIVRNGIEPLVELHDESDLQKIKPLKDSGLNFVIGINNRNLRDLSTSFKPTYNLVSKIRKMFGENQLIITESGISTRGHMVELSRLGVKAGLVGTSIMQSNITEKIRELLGFKSPFIKICGIKHAETFKSFMSNNGKNLTAFGIIVGVETSPRNLSFKQAKNLFSTAPKHLMRVLVTKNKNPKEIMEYFTKLKPDLIQNKYKDTKKDVSSFPKEILNKLIVTISRHNLNAYETADLIKDLPTDIYAALLDSSEGQGKSIDLSFAEKVVELCSNRRIIIAGGITPENLEKAYLRVEPFGMDACSSLEIAKGVKSDEKIQNFLIAAQKLQLDVR